MAKKILKFVFTVAYLGYLPMPGTVASLVTTLIIIFFHYSLSFLEASLATLGLSLLAFAVGKTFASYAEREVFQNSDPSEVVIDEVSGMALALTFLPYRSFATFLLLAGLGLVLFRFFDIRKPFFIKELEQLKAGWGLMVDDTVAAVMTWTFLFPLAFFWWDYY